MSKIKITEDDILVIIDPQRDFIEGGALAVPGGTDALGVAMRISPLFKNVVISQDWHPANHGSFASHHGVDPFTIVQLGGQDQVAWPDHCVQGTKGAELLVEPLNTAVIVRKGMNPGLDSYSAFYENDHITPTGLSALIDDRYPLQGRRLFFVGLARNYCVGFSVLDAAEDELGELFVIEDAVASIPDGSDDAMTARFHDADVNLIHSGDLT